MTEQKLPTCRHGLTVCESCTRPGTGIGRRDAFYEYVERGRILARRQHGGTHSLGAEYRSK